MNFLTESGQISPTKAKSLLDLTGANSGDQVAGDFEHDELIGINGGAGAGNIYHLTSDAANWAEFGFTSGEDGTFEDALGTTYIFQAGLITNVI